MNPTFSKLHSALEALKNTIDSASIPGESFLQQYGWNQTALSSEDLCYAIENMMADIKLFNIDDIEGYEKYLETQVKKVEALTAITKAHYNNNAGHLIHLVPNIAITILVMQKDLEKTFFTWERMEDKKLLPRHLARRLRSTRN